MSNINFAYPGFLYLLLLVPAIIACYVLKQQKAFAAVKLPGLIPLELPVNFRNWLRHLLFALRMATVSLLIIVLARPQSTDRLGCFNRRNRYYSRSRHIGSTCAILNLTGLKPPRMLPRSSFQDDPTTG